MVLHFHVSAYFQIFSALSLLLISMCSGTHPFSESKRSSLLRKVNYLNVELASRYMYERTRESHRWVKDRFTER